MVTKRGLSDVVSNVLIILLVLVAVGILWLFLRPTITKVGDVGGATDCLSVDVRALSCTKVGLPADGDWAVVIERGAGGPKDLQAVKAIFYATDGTSVVRNNTDAKKDANGILMGPPAQLQSIKYTFSGSTFGGLVPVEASVAGVITSSKPEGLSCSASTIKVKCT